MTKLNAKVPAAWCPVLGFKVEVGEGGNKLSYDLQRPAQPMDKAKWGKLIVKNGDTLKAIKITEKNRSGGSGVTLYAFIVNAVKESQKGFLTMADLKELAGLSAITPQAGHPRFREMINKIILGGHLISEKGRGVTDAGEEIDWTVDEEEASEIDFDSLFS